MIVPCKAEPTEKMIVMSKSKPTITDVLKAAIEQSGKSRYQISMQTGVMQTSLSRFMRGGTSLRLDKADKLAAYLGLRLVPDTDPAPPEPAPDKLTLPAAVKAKGKRKAN